MILNYEIKGATVYAGDDKAGVLKYKNVDNIKDIFECTNVIEMLEKMKSELENEIYEYEKNRGYFLRLYDKYHVYFPGVSFIMAIVLLLLSSEVLTGYLSRIEFILSDFKIFMMVISALGVSGVIDYNLYTSIRDDSRKNISNKIALEA